jgi:acyl-CoA thioesterase
MNGQSAITFDTMLAPLASGDDVTVAPTWGQGRATFGGLVAALLYRRAAAVLLARGENLAQKPPRSLTFSLIAPLAPGAARVEVQVLRAGKSVIQLEARIVQDAQVVAVMLASFGASRASEVIITPDTAPLFGTPESLKAFPFIAGITPDFSQHFEFRWAVGEIPFTTRATTGDMGGWVRFRQPVQGFDVAHLLGLVDAWPPAVMPMFSRPAPISTLSWTIEFTDAAMPEGDSPFVQYLAQTDFSAQGYAHIHSRTWRADGTLLAIGRQTVALFI